MLLIAHCINKYSLLVHSYVTSLFRPKGSSQKYKFAKHGLQHTVHNKLKITMISNYAKMQ